MKCWVCHRQARGFGHAECRISTGRSQRYPIDWVFCSRRCQDAFHRLYGNWCKALEAAPMGKEGVMRNLTDIEASAMRTCLKAFGSAADAIGFAKPLGEYSEAEALQVIDAIVTQFTDAMTEHHEASKYPPVRGMPAVADPMATPFADMDDDIPWDTPKEEGQS